MYWRLGDCPRPTVQLPWCPLSIAYIAHRRHPIHRESTDSLIYLHVAVPSLHLFCFLFSSFMSYSVWGAVVKCNIIYWCGMKLVLECVFICCLLFVVQPLYPYCVFIYGLWGGVAEHRTRLCRYMVMCSCEVYVLEFSPCRDELV